MLIQLLLHMARQLGREPMFHFLAAALVLFTIDNWQDNQDGTNSDIVIGADYIESLAEQHRDRVGRIPSGEELKAIVIRHAEEEALVRYGQSLGLHRGDPIVRRRVMQKVYFMAETLARIDEPSDEELSEYLQAHAHVYQRPAQLRITQIYFDTEVVNNALITAAQDSLRAGADPQTIGSMLPIGHRLGWQTPSDLDNLLGVGFADSLADVPIGEWIGPIASRYGQHLVLVMARRPERTPELEEIRNRIRQDLITERRLHARRMTVDKIMSEFSIQINWPEERRPDTIAMREVMP
ncbi:peptidyl-prolyl cis-trans isomerase [Microbulbifer variabilis]|uniref:peptidylprolyl isomerase n=1 Tax=Microbulbifer variabilis TaxID=266805 RepID=UPI001CFDE388|nr:peptidylprolyl isomerase [Microbulbifer variabilis]